MTPPYTYFIDRALGKSVGKALQEIGKNVELHNNHFIPDCPDTEWLPVVSQQNWIVLTKDINIGRNVLEVLAIAEYNARVFILTSGNITSSEMATIFQESIKKIEDIIRDYESPFIAKINRNKDVNLWKSSRELQSEQSFNLH